MPGVEAARAGDAGRLCRRRAGGAGTRAALGGCCERHQGVDLGEVGRAGVKLVTATGKALGLIQSHVVKINEALPQ